MLNNQIFIATTLANDPHTEGIHNASKIALRGDIKTIIIPPALDYKAFYDAVYKYKPKYIGLSYRQKPEIGFVELQKVLYTLKNTGLITEDDNVKINFAGLPDTIAMVQARINELPLSVKVCKAYADVKDKITETVDFFDITENREKIINNICEELESHDIKMFDQLADEVVSHDNYKNELPLAVPSDSAIKDFVTRIDASSIPILRSHFGIPADTIEPTVEGIKKLAEARVIDELSLGSSNLSQRYFGHPEKFIELKNDGGVPYKDVNDLKKLYQASRCGNYPSIKTYCHVTDLVNFIHQCLDVGVLVGAHQAVPLYWFNELDGRGPATVRNSIKEHFAAVRELAKYGIPVEMNDPNQWSSRWAHDTIIVTSYGLISAVMTMCGVDNMVLQMQFNKPKETGDYADLAKMAAGLAMAKKINSGRTNPARILRETRTGIESLSVDMTKAKWQLARSTILQMCVKPDIIHIVSYCEANYAAKPDDIIDSSKLVRKAVQLFRENEEDINKLINNSIINDRKKYLMEESSYLLEQIASLNSNYRSDVPLNEIAQYIGNEDVIASSIEKKMMSAPGIINAKYREDFITKPTKYGMINLVDNYNNPHIISEKERLKFNESIA